MKEEIGKNNYYVIEVDKDLNRMYLKISGYWKSDSDVLNYINDISKAKNCLKTNFTVLTDVTEMKTPPVEIGELHKQAQKILVEHGLDRTAEILPESAVQKMTLERYAKESGMKKRVFTNKIDAEVWLNEKG